MSKCTSTVDGTSFIAQIGSGQRSLQLQQSPLTGLAKSFALEHPDLWGGLLDLSESPGDEQAQCILSMLARPTNEFAHGYRSVRVQR